MKWISIFLLILVVLVGGCGAPDREVVFQVSTIDALLDGVYDGEYTLGELTQKGDLGIGTFDALQGEMVVIDSEVYQINTDGSINKMSDETTTPFAAVTFFDVDRRAVIVKASSLNDLYAQIEKHLPSKNIFYAIRIDGEFDYLKTRSVPKQNKPYPKLAEVVKTQTIFEIKKTRGTILGFNCPQYVKGVNVPGFHLHYISADRKSGGHLLDCRIKNVTAKIDEIRGFAMQIPSVAGFAEADLTKDRSKELHKVEK